ncbi:MAG: aminotransferase class I/II-fold pyridoxal phosphate-dependent enzyme [Candidatus Acidiferrales bacterium]
MFPASLSRRDFSRSLAQSLAVACAAAPALAASHAALADAAPGAATAGPVRINYNENPYGPSPRARRALADSGSIAGRYPMAARDEIVAALAKKHGVTPDNIAIGCGSTEILRVADNAFLDPSKNVVAAEPTFEAVLDYAGVLHANPVKIPLTADHRHDLPRMAAACTSKTGVVYICNPNNPTGTIVTRDEVAAFIGGVSPSTLILVDEAYFDFVEDARYSSATEFIAAHPNVVVARTFSKIYGLAGMRLGYAIAEKQVIARLAAQTVQDNANAAVLSAAQASLDDRLSLNDTRRKLNGTRDWLFAQFAKDGRSFIPSHANFFMIDMGSDVQPFIEQLSARQVLVGRRFPSLPNFMRVSVGTQNEMETFLAALRQIAPGRSARAA